MRYICIKDVEMNNEKGIKTGEISFITGQIYDWRRDKDYNGDMFITRNTYNTIHQWRNIYTDKEFKEHFKRARKKRIRAINPKEFDIGQYLL